MADRKSDINHILSHVRHLFTGAPITEPDPEASRPGTIIGETRSQAIDWVQDQLGPVTPRNVAEDTYLSLVAEGVIEVEIGRVALLEAQSEEELRVRASNTVHAQAGKRIGAMRRGRLMARSTTSSGARSSHHSHTRSRHNRTMKNGGDMTARTLDDDDN